jgi:hypothetical protein
LFLCNVPNAIVRRVEFLSEDVAAWQDAIEIQTSGDILVERNWFGFYTATQSGGTALRIENATGSIRIFKNTVDGFHDFGVSIQNILFDVPVRIDNNSMWLDLCTAIALAPNTGSTEGFNACVRNNLFISRGTVFLLDLGLQPFDANACVPASGQNVMTPDVDPICQGTCTGVCLGGSGPLCPSIAYQNTDFDDRLCPTADGSLVDAAVAITGWGVTDDPSEPYVGAGPDVGSFELGSSSQLAGFTYQCP